MATPELKFLHPDSSLVQSKIELFEKLSTDELIESLKPGNEGSLRVKQDGLVMNGNHRLKVLKNRGIDINALPREVIRDQDRGLGR